jgi:membrane protein implicated in regulation of membrane protease activity
MSVHPDIASLLFGLAAIALNLGWAYWSWQTPERHMAFAFAGYALACAAFLWPVVRRLIDAS